MKDAYPVPIAEYAVANKIATQPAFNWWFRSVLRKRAHIIDKVKSRYLKWMYKYVVELLHKVQEALDIDERSGVHLWLADSERETTTVMPAFEFKDTARCRPVANTSSVS